MSCGRQEERTGGDEVRQCEELRAQGVKNSDLVLLYHNVHPNTSPLIDGTQCLHLGNEGLGFIVKISSNARTFILLGIKWGSLGA